MGVICDSFHDQIRKDAGRWRPSQDGGNDCEDKLGKRWQRESKLPPRVGNVTKCRSLSAGGGGVSDPPPSSDPVVLLASALNLLSNNPITRDLVADALNAASDNE